MPGNRLLVDKIEGRYMASGYLDRRIDGACFAEVVNYVISNARSSVGWLIDEPVLNGLFPEEEKAVRNIRSLILRKDKLEERATADPVDDDLPF